MTLVVVGTVASPLVVTSALVGVRVAGVLSEELYFDFKHCNPRSLCSANLEPLRKSGTASLLIILSGFKVPLVIVMIINSAV